MFCYKCGNKIYNQNAKFCQKCGADLSIAFPNSAKAPEIKSEKTQESKKQQLDKEISKIKEMKKPQLDKEMIKDKIDAVKCYFIDEFGSVNYHKVGKAAIPVAVVLVLLVAIIAIRAGKKEALVEESSQVEYSAENTEVYEQEQMQRGEAENNQTYNFEALNEKFDFNSKKNKIKYADYFTKKQNAAINQKRLDAYNAEKEFIPSYLEMAFENYGSDSYIDLSDMFGVTEEFYSIVKEHEPNIQNKADTYMLNKFGPDAYLFTDIFLRDDEIGQVVRGATEAGLLTVAEFLINWDPKPTDMTAISLKPIASSASYILMRTNGTVGAVIEEACATYDYAIKELKEYDEKIISLDDTSSLDRFYNIDVNNPEKVEECYQCFLSWAEMNGRRNAIDEKIAEYETTRDEVRREILEKCGIFEEISEEQNTSYYIYYIFDQDKNICGAFYSNMVYDETAISNEGYITMYQTGAFNFHDIDNNTLHIILDKNGKLLYKDNHVFKDNQVKEGTVIYANPSSNGNVLRYTFNNNFDYGNYYSVDLVKPDQSETHLIDISTTNDTGYIIDSFFDYISVTDAKDKDNVWIDINNGKILSKEEYDQICNEELENFEYDPWEEKYAQKPEGIEYNTEADENHVAINLFDYTLLGDYFYRDNVLYNPAGETVKTLDEGDGVYKIFYSSKFEMYVIATNSHYFYYLDKDLNPILDSVRCGDNSRAKVQFDENYGLLVDSVNQSNSYYDEEESDDGVSCELYNIRGEKVHSFNNKDVEYGYGLLGAQSTGWFKPIYDSDGVCVSLEEYKLISKDELKNIKLEDVKSDTVFAE